MASESASDTRDHAPAQKAMRPPPSKIFVDGGDPEETNRIKRLIGFVDGQTTNPSLIAKNPEVRELVSSGHTLTEEEEAAEYRKIVEAISPLVGDGGVSIEVFADLNTTADHMLKQGRGSIINNASVQVSLFSPPLSLLF